MILAPDPCRSDVGGCRGLSTVTVAADGRCGDGLSNPKRAPHSRHRRRSVILRSASVARRRERRADVEFKKAGTAFAIPASPCRRSLFRREGVVIVRGRPGVFAVLLGRFRRLRRRCPQRRRQPGLPGHQGLRRPARAEPFPVFFKCLDVRTPPRRRRGNGQSERFARHGEFF